MSPLHHTQVRNVEKRSNGRRFTFGSVLTASLLLSLSGCGADMDETDDSTDRAVQALSQIKVQPHKALCEHSTEPGIMHCHARVITDAAGAMAVTAKPQGLGPTDLRSAYNLPASGGAGKTIAIVDAFDDPNAEKDLGVYRSQFGMTACTTANGCFKKVNQNGLTTSLPKADAGWSGEISLDLDMASAGCPDCKILLVEANSASDADLMAAVTTAVKLGANVISNSYGGAEDSSILTNDSAWFNHPGVTITASAGDDGYGAEYPATSRYVLAVGGTSLVKSSTTRGWTEGVWGTAANSDGGTGSGCSQFVSKPSWQKDTGCAKRTAADVAAVADPSTGVSVYDTYQASGWAVYGGTSAAAPLVGAILAVTGNSGSDNSISYTKSTAFYDVTTGTNGSCGGSYLCTAKAGYDGPTGNGTPNGAALMSGGSTTPPPMCTPSCSGKTCGSDGCGGTCGTCGSGQSCSSAGQCTTTAPSCTHAICSSGSKLSSGCDPCATQICAEDSYCCGTRWDATCVSEVRSICGESC